MSQMVYLTCENHTELRWLVKTIAVNRTGRYNGSRNIFFCGRLYTPAERKAIQEQSGKPPSFDSSEVIGGELIRECSCSSALLTIAPENLTDFAKEFAVRPLTQEETQTLADRVPVPVS